MENRVKPPYANAVGGAPGGGKTAWLADLAASILPVQRPPTDLPNESPAQHERLSLTMVEAKRRLRDHVAEQPQTTYIHDSVDLGLSLDQHMRDAMRYGQAAPRVHRAPTTLQDFSDSEMVMDMIRRGYAVMKLPDDGGPPGVLKK